METLALYCQQVAVSSTHTTLKASSTELQLPKSGRVSAGHCVSDTLPSHYEQHLLKSS